MAERNGMNYAETIEYYNKNAAEYVEKTKNCDMGNLYHEFEQVIPAKCKILDLGCGSGRDSAYFSNAGNDVISIDASKEMCEQARKRTTNPVIQMRIEEIDYKEEFDAIWACASLLHIPRDQIGDVIQKISGALKKNGVLYSSWKYGNYDAIESSRLFSYFDERGIKQLFGSANDLSVVKMWVTEDVSGRDDKWINVLARRVN